MEPIKILTNKFVTKDKLKAFIQSQTNGLDKFLLFSSDRTVAGNKYFHYLPCDEVDRVTELLKTNSHIYELLPPDVAIKPYFDLEIERDGITSDECNESLKDFCSLVIKEIKKCYSVTLEQTDFIVLNACRCNKLSYHLIIQNKIYFKSVIAMKQFILKFNRVVQGKNAFLWNSKNGEHKTIMDIAPYSTDQNIRCINQSKMSNTFLLKNDTIDPVDSLVRLYWGVGDKIGIEYNETEGLTKNRGISDTTRKTKKQKAEETNVMELYDATGLTIMCKLNLTYESLRGLPEWKQYLYLIPNKAQNRAVFMSIGYCLRNVGGTQEDWREWAKLSSKYTLGSQIQNFSSFQTGERAYQVSFFKRLAQKAHPYYFDEGQRILHQEYLQPNYKNMRIVEEDCEFVSQEYTIHENNILSNERLILLVARLGGGKTVAIKRLIEEKQYKRVLFISPRTSFSYFVAEEFGLSVYLDTNVNLKSDKLVISVESLWKLADEGVKPYDLIVLDEIEANLSVFSSVTCKRQWKIWNDLTNLIKSSQQTITAGAFITQKTIDFLLSFQLSTVCIKNTTKPIQKKAIELSPKYFILKLLDSTKRGEKNYVCYSSLRQMKNDLAILNGCGDQNVVDGLKTALIYSSEGDDNTQKEQLRNMASEWKKTRLVMTTPTITVGNSYSIPDDFDNVFIRSSPTCIIPDIFQCHRRVRYTKSNILYFSLPTKEIKTYNKRFSNHKLEILRNFNDHNMLNTELTIQLLKELKQKKELQQYKNDAEDSHVDINTLLYNLENRNSSPKALQDLLYFNFMENTLSQCYYDEMFAEFLPMNNYETTFLSNDSDAEEAMNVELNDLEQKAVYTQISYQDIPVIDEYELEELRKKQTHKEATRKEKLQIEAFYFNAVTNVTQEELYDNLIQIRDLHIEITKEIVDFYDDTEGTKLTIVDVLNPTVTIDSKTLKQYMLNLWFKEYVLISHNHHYYTNHKSEINNSIETSCRSVIDPKITTNETLSTKPLKLNYILTINRKLGIPSTGINILNKQVVIPRIQIEDISPYLREEYVNILSAFGLSKSKSSTIDTKTIITLLSRVYNSWNRCKFVPQKDKHNKVIALELKPHPSYRLFTPFTKQSRQELQGCRVEVAEEEAVTKENVVVEEIKSKKNIINMVVKEPIKTKGTILEYFALGRKVK